ncbi:MAG: 23S rRNA (adenine(2503)-C(2))-methyltransferase RlmN [Paludibacteraceae bacterium]|nr:23S rRNA (adenine(2503)-C(2))-methyltransferase RlmN [Paludibacteraceae bacterium]
MKTHLLGLTLDELTKVALDNGLPKFVGKQMCEWLYKKHVSSIDDMTNISLKNRELLKEKYEIGRYLFADRIVSNDETVKYLFEASEGKYIESVMIPDKERMTLCISSQIGCKMNCLFCATGKQGFSGQLSVSQILNQVLSVEESEMLTNIVFMGMGEPMDNLNNVLKVIEILTADYGFAWSPKRITVSTIGIMPAMERFINSCSCHLAISLHAPNAMERQLLMPMQKTQNISHTISVIRKYDWSHQRRVSFEYIMFEDLNDTDEHALQIVELLKGISCRVNLIRFHAIPNVGLKPSSQEKMEHFCNLLNRKNITTTIRRSRGEDIMAACGMLARTKK